MNSLRFFSYVTVLGLSLAGTARADHHGGGHAAAAVQHANPARQIAAAHAAHVSQHSTARNFNGRNFRSNGLADRGHDSHHHDSHHDSHDSHYSRAWWDRYHHHDRVVFLGGSYLYNPYYSAGNYGPGYYGSSYYGDDYYPSRPVYQANVVDGSVAVDVQRRLRREGYYRGPIDGDVGPGTRGAIAAFQRDNGLAPNGRITGSLLEALGLS